MARGPRLDCRGSLHHVYSRAVEGRSIFSDPREAEELLGRFDLLIPRTGARVFAWALMPTHFHLLLECGREPLHILMQSILSGFCTTFNRRNGHRGHVFMSRFHSILVDKDSYYTNLLRYIHLNPVRAGLVPSLHELCSYPYTGHPGISGGFARTFHDADGALSLLAGSRETALAAYERLLCTAVPADTEGILTRGNLMVTRGGILVQKGPVEDQRRFDFQGGVLGQLDFAKRICDELAGRNRIAIRRPCVHQQVEESLELVLSRFNLSRRQFFSKSWNGRKSEARAVLFHLLSAHGLSQADIARFLHVTPQAVHKMARRTLDKPCEGPDPHRR
jgi:putative transposase